MGALSDIQAILAYDNLDNPISGFKDQLLAWETELMNPASNNRYDTSFVFDAVTYRSRGGFPATAEKAAGEGFSDVLTSQPILVAALSDVIDLDAIFTLIYDLIAGVDDDFDVDSKLLVSDITGTNLASAIISTNIPALDGGDLNVAWGADATTSIDAGTDLAWTGSILGSTAGGVFVVTLTIQGGWD